MLVMLIMIGLAVVCTLVCIGLALFFIYAKKQQNKTGPAKEISPEQADETASTRSVLNH